MKELEKEQYGTVVAFPSPIQWPQFDSRKIRTIILKMIVKAGKIFKWHCSGGRFTSVSQPLWKVIDEWKHNFLKIMKQHQ